MYRNYRNGGWKSEANRAAYVAKAVSRNNAPVYPTGVYLAAVAQVIRENGFFKELCASQAFELVVKNQDGQHEFAVQDFVTAGNAVGWLASKDVRPGFESDLLSAVTSVDIAQNKMKLAMYVVKMYVENQERVAAAPKSDSQHIGTVGERLTLSVEVFDTYYADSAYGPSYRTKASTKDGNVVMFYHKQHLSGVIDIVGTVTKHGEYNGVKETYLNRVKVGA